MAHPGKGSGDACCNPRPGATAPVRFAVTSPGPYPAYYSIPGSMWPGEAWPGNTGPLILPETGFALGEPYFDWAFGPPCFRGETGLPYQQWAFGSPRLS